MREITCGDGTRWQVQAVAHPPAGGAGAPPAAEEVALLECVTCEGTPRHVTVRAPAGHWRDLDVGEICRLIAAAEAEG